MREWLRANWQEALKTLRDTSSWVLGLYLAFREVTDNGPERMSDVLLIAGLLGLPIVFRQDEKHKPGGG